jgi:hypothetical protein
MRIVVLGLIGQYPLAGMTSYFLQYVLGFRRLGHDVYYLEDNGACPYDPRTDSVSMDVSYTVGYLRRHFEAHDLGDRWAYRDYNGEYYGLPAARVRELLRTADLLVNVSIANALTEEHRQARRVVLIDTDPPFRQIAVAQGDAGTLALLTAHDVLFTFAENIGGPGWRIPLDGGLHWHPTRQPVVLDLWEPVIDPQAQVLTTVMNWTSYASVEFQGEQYGQKDVEFIKIMDLPRRVSQPLELALAHPAAPRELLLAHGWRLTDPLAVSRDLWAYRDYIARSRGEFSVAKNAYVRSWSGWFSERSTCYLALGKPVITQDTGFSQVLPVGEGLLAWHTLDEAVAAIEALNADYERHCHVARALAEIYFDSDRVLSELLEVAFHG